MDQKLGWRINEFLLLLIILFQLLDFIKILTPFWDYVKKIISWALIGYLLYRASPSALLFGEKRSWWDASLIGAYFLMALKTILRFASVAREQMALSILDYVHFIPGTSAAQSILTIPMHAAELDVFLYGVPYVPNATMYASPFASQLTLTNSAIPFTLQAGNETASALLQPYGLDGMILQLYNTIVQHGALIERAGFIAGACLLLLLGLYAAFRFQVRGPSVLQVIHEEGGIKGIRDAFSRLFTILFLMAAFFTILFNLVVEWLAIAVDAPLAMLGLAAYGLIAFRFHRRYHRDLETDDLISRIGNFGSAFIKDFANLFTTWRTIPLGLSGLLVLHLLVDIGNFVIPYIIGRKDPLYFGQLGAGHEPIITHILASWGADLATNLAMLGLYLLNTVGILFLLLLPAYIWYKSFQIVTREKGEPEEKYHPRLASWVSGLGLISILAFLLAPAFLVKGISNSTLVGVDLQTRAITTAFPVPILLGLLILFAALLVAGRSKRLNELLMAPLFLASILFFGAYILRFFLSTVNYHLREGAILFHATTGGDLFLGVWILVFLVINLLFYIFGFVSYLYELRPE